MVRSHRLICITKNELLQNFFPQFVEHFGTLLAEIVTGTSTIKEDQLNLLVLPYIKGLSERIE